MSGGAAGLHAQVRELGLGPGDRVLVHAGLRGTGLAAEAVRDALVDVLGPAGTLVVPAFTAQNSRTSDAHLALTAGMTGAEAAAFRAAMPAFDPWRTPSHGMGRLAECVRTSPGARRSAHPQTSFAALGRDARWLCAGHRTECHLGEESPLGTLFWAGAKILLINVGFSVCTAFHLAEYRIPKPPVREYRCVVNLRGKARWIGYEDVALDDGDFAEIGSAFPESALRRGRLGGAAAMTFEITDAVDHALAWMTENRR
ncbi:AAC(3) family N-acetyltransferase [Streptomyces sp. NRRL S-87]|uniref:AAC(3) family N-acetyltransferase n=1 Tax=Streptomyces sp. NRRL S-87 TaxID=1463920 RepID=UPI0004C0D6D5|nr:AAC(3) family N-acetyltransferase [Streptomyces sp. NRRL S-87]